MVITLRERTEDHVKVYFEKASDPEIKKWLPQKAKTLDEAIRDFHLSLAPESTSFGRTIYANERYVGDIWCYCIGDEPEPDGMISYCIFEKDLWNKGIAKAAVSHFLNLLREKFSLHHIGAFTYSANSASISVLLSNGFILCEEFEEDGIMSVYFQKDM